MTQRLRRSLAVAVGLVLSPAALADSPPSSEPPPVPVTRTDLKQTLENSKHSQPRLPLPPLTAAEKTKADAGDWSVVNNGRMRRHYLPPELIASGLGRGQDPEMSLGYPFQTMIFWIVSRGNNCTYCMGHQESKLAAAGVTEDTIAALDGDWSEFTTAERAAFAWARKLTFDPHEIQDADLDRLRPFYNDKQILEILLATGNFNAMNRWTGALKIPQEEHRVYLTPTAPKYRDLLSRVAPLPADLSGKPSEPVRAVPSKRAELGRAEIEAALAAAKARSPRLPLVSDEAARTVLASVSEGLASSGAVPQWVRLLANFPKAGGARIAVHEAAATKGELDPRLRAMIAFVSARQDRAWYALDLAHKRLRALGLTDEQIFALDGKGTSVAGITPAESSALAFARTLTIDPARITDADVTGLRKSYSDKQVAEIIWHGTEAAFFDRLTEAAGLRVGE